MAEGFSFAHRVAFRPAEAEATLREVPAAPGVFALRGEREADEPYITRTADLRRRLRRLLAPPEEVDAEGRAVLSRRLNLRDRVHAIEWTRTGSEFESNLLLYHATRAAFGAERARKRLKLYPPFCVRLTAGHDHPRLYVSNRLARRTSSLPRATGETFGPFPSRLAAERFCDAVLDLFKLRRCWEDLAVHPEHPGCAYGEMKRCLAPCQAVCSGEEYGAETARVRAFLATRGESLLAEAAQAREAASENMDFELAAALHTRWEKVKAAAALADPVVAPLESVRTLVVQPAAPPEGESRTEDAAVFLLQGGVLVGPARLSTLGVRAVREQTAVGSSLFAQPLMLAAVPLAETAAGPLPAGEAAPPAETVPLVEVPAGLQAEGSSGRFAPACGEVMPASASASPEDRARAVLAQLEAVSAAEAAEGAEPGDALSLFRRWYFRPEKSRPGEALLPNPDGSWPIRRLLNGAARVALGPPAEAAAVDREAAKVLGRERKTRVLHEGRPDVERVVPVLPKRPRSRKSVLPGDRVSP